MGKSFSDVRRVQQAFEEFVEGTIDDDVTISISQVPSGDGYGFFVLIYNRALATAFPPTFDDIPVTVDVASPAHILPAEWNARN